MENQQYRFRSWHKKKKYMYNNVAIGLNEKVLYLRGTPKKKGKDWYVSEEYEEDIVIMQFIGLKDDGKNDIYEGDILKVGAQEKLAQVCWNRESAKFELEFLDNGRTIDFADKRSLRNIRIVGNIFENPEFIGGDPLEVENLEKNADGGKNTE